MSPLDKDFDENLSACRANHSEQNLVSGSEDA